MLNGKGLEEGSRYAVSQLFCGLLNNRGQLFFAYILPGVLFSETEPLTPRSILKLYSPPMDAHFDEAVEFKFYVGNEIFSSRNFGKMTIEKVYPVKYLLTSDINESEYTLYLYPGLGTFRN